MARTLPIASPGLNGVEREADQQIVAGLVRGEVAEVDAFVRTHQQRVAHLAQRLLGWGHDVEDVVQEVFVSVLQHIPRFRGESRLSTWLYRITVNECRRQQRRRRLRLRFWERESVRVAEPQHDDRRERHARVRDAVAGLPVRDREVVVLRYLEELSIPEMSEILGLARNAVEVRLTRARQRLRGPLAELWQE